MTLSTEVRALSLSEWVFCQMKQSLSNLPVLRFYLREYWACSRPSRSFEVVGFFVLSVLVAKPSSRQYQTQIRSLVGNMHAYVLAELEAALVNDSGPIAADLRAILMGTGKLPAVSSSRHSQELGLGVIRKLVTSFASLASHRTEISKALEMTTDEARDLLFPFLSFRASGSSSMPFRRFLPKVRSSQEPTDRHILLFEPLPPMVTRLDLDGLLAISETRRFPEDSLTVVLDLDETLVNFKESVGLRLRPGVIEFLTALAEFARPVIFTAATEDYGNWAITQLENAGGPKGIPRLFRQHAFPFGPVFLKDLTRLGSPLNRTIIVDNVRENFALQPGNGIEIISWFGHDPKDRALEALLPTLRELATRKDMSVHEFLKAKTHQLMTSRYDAPRTSVRKLPSPSVRRPH